MLYTYMPIQQKYDNSLIEAKKSILVYGVSQIPGLLVMGVCLGIQSVQTYLAVLLFSLVYSYLVLIFLYGFSGRKEQKRINFQGIIHRYIDTAKMKGDLDKSFKDLLK